MSRLSICIVIVLSVVPATNQVLARMHHAAPDLIPAASKFALTPSEVPVRTIQGVINDSCFEPLLIGDGETLFSTVGADTDGLPHELCEYDGQTYHDIWFQYIAACNISLTVSTCNTADYDTDLVVYDGCSPDSPCPPDDSLVLGCSDDALGCAGFTSEVSVPVVAGNCYTIRIGGWNDGDEGNGAVSLTCDDACGDGVVGEGEQCDPPDGETCDADCQLILCGLDEECCCCPGEGCFGIDLILCTDMGCTPVDECLGDSNDDGEDDACVDACCLGDGSCEGFTEEDCLSSDGIPVQACLGDLDGDGRDDACTCQTDADCDDGNPCTLNLCDPDTVMCLTEFMPEFTPCESEGELCSLGHCDGFGACILTGDVVCEASCPACEGDCDPETGLCPCATAKMDGDWSSDIWNLPGPSPYPDNISGVPGLGAVIQDFIDVFLNLTVEIESLCLLNGGILRVTAGGTGAPTGDITVIGPMGILIEGSLFVADSHTIDASAGPVTIGPNGRYLADPAATSDVNAELLAAEVTMLEATLPNGPATMELTDSMLVTTGGNFRLDGTNYSDKGDCTPPDLNVIDSGRIEVGGDFVIHNAAQVEYASSVPMSLQGNFDNQSLFPILFDWADGGVLLTSAGPAVQTIEAAGEDRGRCATGFIDNFSFGTLEVQSGTTADIVDAIDNQDDGFTNCDEALYVELLVVSDQAALNTNGCRVYYRNLINDGSIPGLGVEVLEIERADLDEDCFVGAGDLAILLGAWGRCPDPCPPSCPADLSNDCEIDAFDLALLLGKWGPVD